jgi:integrase
MITEAQIRSALRKAPASGKKSVLLTDDSERGAGRLALLIRPFKDRTICEWYCVYYRDGKRRSTKIASYPALSLAEARKRFREELAPTISTGGDPVGSHARKRRQDEERRVSVRELFTAYVEDMKRAGKRSKQAERILLSETTGAARAIGADRPAAEIEASDIVPYLADIHGRGAVVMANQTRAYLGAAFAFGLRSAHDYTRQSTGADWGLKANPVLAIKSDSTAHRSRDRYLAPAEFRKFWNWLIEHDQMSALAPALRLMLATGQRAEETLRIGFESRYLQPQKIVHWDKTKNGRQHAIPLPLQAVEILDKLIPNRHGLYFPNRRHPNKAAPYGGLESVIRRYLKKTGAAHFCPRDIRRTWKTLAGEAGIDKQLRDRLQNHSRSDISSVHYDRYEYLAEKRAAMMQWAAYLDRILAGELDERETAEVVSIGKAAA